MIAKSDIITINVSAEEVGALFDNARKCCIGGPYSVRKSEKEVKDHLFEDQLVGQIGEWLVTRWMLGLDFEYWERRKEINKNPYKGDGGYDILNLPIDVKSGGYRYHRMNILNYRLRVNERDMPEKTDKAGQIWEDKIYFYVLVDPVQEHEVKATTARIMGWVWGRDFRTQKEKYGMFNGKDTTFEVPTSLLHPAPLIYNEPDVARLLDEYYLKV